MRTFNPAMIEIANWRHDRLQPDVAGLLAVLRRDVPARPTLFEFFLNDSIYEAVTADLNYDRSDPQWTHLRLADAYRRLGYDYITVQAHDLGFPHAPSERQGRTTSLNAHIAIRSHADADAYPWPDFAAAPMPRLDRLRSYMAPGMGLLVHGPCGVEENLFNLLGYDQLCYLTVDDPSLIDRVSTAIGERLLLYYERAAAHPAVDALIVNDDWGFSDQTLLAPTDLRRWIIPWHRRIVAAIHAAGKPAILHCCGNLDAVMVEIINDIGYDAKHSFEDKIQPVEEAYELYHDRIAILGGIDVDYLIRRPPEEVYERACRLLELTAETGGYALGSGNSIPDYVPLPQYLALVAAAVYNRDLPPPAGTA